MLGVVLCGGQSSRMGNDKGLLKLEAKTWAQTAIDKLSELQVPIVISINEKQLPEYKAVFPATELVCDNPSLSINGPLAALLGVHLLHPDEDLAVLACDLPLMEPVLIKELLRASQSNPSKTAFYYTSGGEPEPLCGIYRAAALSHTYALYQQQGLKKHSMKYMLEHVDCYPIPIPDGMAKCFRNFNAHAELNGL